MLPQGLGAVITDYSKMCTSDHTLYVFTKRENHNQVG
jgi:hypothetical protein